MTTWVVDLDGVVWLADRVIAGSVEAVARLRERGDKVVFVTNNSNKRVGDYVAKLEDMGVPAEAGDVITSAQAAAAMLEPGTTALVCAGPGVEEALRERGVEPVKDGKADAVVVGWFPEFDYEWLTTAAHAVTDGARLIGTNDDATYPTPDGRIPGGGSLLAAVAVASGATPEVAGKPHEPMADLVRERVGEVDVLVGDRPSTDGAMARLLGAKFVLVLSGVTSGDDLPSDLDADEVVADLAELVPDS